LATFLVNILGSFVMGLLWGWQSETPLVWSPAVRGALFTGLLGGFTTFSAYSLEGVQLYRGGDETTALSYVGGSVIFGLAAVWGGLILGQRVSP
jgi:fluoride exporter